MRPSLLNPQDMVPFTSRTLAYTLMGRGDDAQRDLERAVELGFDRAMLEGLVAEAKKQR